MAGFFMGIHRDLHMGKVLIATISSAEFNCTNLNSKLSQVVTYINDNKYRKRCYVILKLMFLCIMGVQEGGRVCSCLDH